MPLFDLPLPELETYAPALDEPADLDAFWARTLAESREAGGDLARSVRLERVETGLDLVVVDDVTFPGFAGQPVKAWLVRPAEAARAAAAGDGAPLPAVVEFLGYGGGRGLPHEHLAWANAGYAHLVVDTRGQGSQWGSGGGTPDPAGSGPAVPGVLTRGIEDPHDHYYRRVFTDGVRAVDAVRSVRGIDPERVAVHGVSQGGGIAIAVAGLADGLVAALPDVPFLCHYRRAVEITDRDPYRELTRYLAVHRDAEETVFRTLSYLDGAVLGRRATAPALFSVALMDQVCPPSTVYAAYNGWGAAAGAAPDAERAIDVYRYNEHEGGQGYRFARQLAWLRDR
ncbi:MAG: acetylxylan esterase [Cellulosimicrobium funkei]|uniref:Acetylxylan esterase n=1 Tax=Cellulosimicrobium cellulans TaxID=1710 RepID=A0AAV5P878_CELCE|nr:acetylxylan esterase [Cellulosimicrobium cellulans]QDP76561.1 acetylxylan esterase [Cellulosimicrobium cellulans]GLY57912.1 acetylxylan esterase [Cellulosimicrobium cellulans]